MRKEKFTRLLIVFTLFLSQLAISQTLDWVKKGSSYGFDYGYADCVDASGNVYVTGQFEFQASFDATHTLTSVGLHDIFVAKYNSSGTLLWAKSFGTKGGDAGHGIALDKSGNIFIAAEMDGTIHFENGDSLKSYGINDALIMKLDNNGKFLWARQAGGGDNDKGRGIAVDGAGNAYMTGELAGESYFKGNGVQVNVNLGQLTNPSRIQKDMFVAKYDPNGKVLWAKDFGSDSTDDEARSIACDKKGNVYFTGYFKNTASFGSTSLTSSGELDILVARLTPADGNVVWAKKAGGLYLEVGRGIAVDTSGTSVYVTGEFSYGAVFGAFTPSNAGRSDVFLAKYNAADGAVIWAKSAGGTWLDIGRSVYVDNYSNVYLTGSFALSAAFQGGTALTTADSADIFVACYGSDGTFQWNQKAGGDTVDEGMGVCVDNNGKVYVAGYFGKTASFSGTSEIASANPDIFIARYHQSVSSTEPTSASTALSGTPGTCGQMQLSWTNGNGTRHLVIAKEGNSISSKPVDGIPYQANSKFGFGSDIGGKSYVVYDGNANSVAVTNLGSGMYSFQVFEFNGSGFNINYLTSSSASANATSNGLPLSVTSSHDTICNQGGSTVLTASGGTSYMWGPAAGLSSTTGASVVASPSVTTTYSVVTTNGSCSRSAAIIVNVEICTGINTNVLPLQDISLYPNPVSNSFALQFNADKPIPLRLKIYNMMGQLVLNKNMIAAAGQNNETVDVRSLSGGIYLLKMESSEGSVSQKIIIQ